MPLEAKGKSFNALKPLEVLPLKDSPWNQLGWCVFPYDGAYQSGLPVKGARDRERGRERLGEEGIRMHLDVEVHTHAVKSILCFKLF